jgi:hypothetical protein
VDDYRGARQAYLTSTVLSDLDGLRARVDRARLRADRVYDRRQILLYVFGGIYAASILDAVFLFPGTSQGSYAALAPWGPEGPHLALGESSSGELTAMVRWTPREGGDKR